MADDLVLIDGLRAFRTALRDAQRDLPRALTTAHREVARVVVAGATPRLVSKTGKPQAKVTIAAGASQTAAFVRLRGATAFGTEFGAHRFKQFRPHRGRQGYAVYPTIRETRPLVEAMYVDAVERAVVRRAFPS
jgi:hypothetical protein